MNLAKIKELEGLREELSELQKQRNEDIKRDKAEFFKKGIEEFNDFFKQQGFDTQENSMIDCNGNKNRVIIANYNNFKVDIAIPPVDVYYMGADSVWDLNVSKDKAKYSLQINRFKDNDNTKIKSTIHVGELTEDEKIEKEIKETEERIEELKIKLGEKTIYVFRLMKEKNNNQRHHLEQNQQFGSMIELLNHLFN